MGFSELDAKALYTKTARGLETYGVTFFLVKEKMQSKNKLVPRLLGVTKDSVLRLDERTKDILKVWPLTTVRRWAASPNTFTLDFGDYSDQYYSVQTPEGEQIAQLIAGYIDIILKKKQAKDHLGIEGDEGSTLVEDNISPFRATIVQRQPPAKPTPITTDSVAKPAIMHAGPDGLNTFHTGHIVGAQNITYQTQLDVGHTSQSTVQQMQITEAMSGAHKAIMSGRDAVNKSKEYLDQPLNLPPLGTDPASRKWKETTLDSKKQNIHTQIAAMSAATAHVVTLTSTDVVDSGAVGEAVSVITSGLPDVAKDVRMIAALMDDSGEKLIDATRKLCNAFSDMLTAAEPEGKEISNDKCRDELTRASRRVAQSVESVLVTSNQCCQDTNLRSDLETAARDVSTALNRLLDHIRPQQRASIDDQVPTEGTVDTILIATDKIITSEDSSDMVRQARVLAQATAHLIQSIKGEAEKTPDSDLQRKLIAAAKVLAEATSRLVEAAKACASNPNAPTSQNLLRQAAQDLREATNIAAGGAVQRKGVKRLEAAAKNAASAAAQTIAASQSASPHCFNSTTRDAMSSDCRAVADTIPQVVSTVKASMQSSNEDVQDNLIEATSRFIKPCDSLVATTKKASNFIDDSSSSRHLTQCSQKLAVELVELRTALDRMKADIGMAVPSHSRKQLEAAADKVHDAKDELVACKIAAAGKELRPLPGDDVHNAIQRLNASVRRVSPCTDQLANSVIASDFPAAALSAQGLSSGLTDLVVAARAVAATSDSTGILNSTELVLDRSWTLIKESHGLIGTNETPEQLQMHLSPIVKGIHIALERITASLPGQQDIDDAIDGIASTTLAAEKQDKPQSGKTYGQLQAELQQLASDVADSATEIVNVSSNLTKLGAEAKYFSSKTGRIIDASSNLARLHEDVQVREDIFIGLRNVSIVSTNLLVVAKSASTNPDTPGTRSQLTAAARAVSDCLNQLIDACSSAAPGQKECDNAVRKIQALKPLLNNPKEPVNASSYFDCQQIVVENSKLLGDSMTGIANYAKEGRLDLFGESVNSAAEAICGLVESSAQAAYLLAAAEPTSVAGKPGLVDMTSINSSTQNIKSACQVITSSKVTQQQLLSAATTIAKHTSSLCTSCRVASERTNDPSTRRQFVQMAKDVANSTASLVKEIKALDHDRSTEKWEKCNKATSTLVKSVNLLVQYASQPEFVSQPAKISSQGRIIQEPVLASGRNV
ncbi:unnamed protein product, partial [Allacma fusca]